MLGNGVINMSLTVILNVNSPGGSVVVGVGVGWDGLGVVGTFIYGAMNGRISVILHVNRCS